jgi:hypothetical protein
MTIVDIDAKIPNNVGLADDRRLQRALESWQPKFVEWWKVQSGHKRFNFCLIHTHLLCKTNCLICSAIYQRVHFISVEERK